MDQERELNRLEVLRGLRLSTWDGALATIWVSLTTGAFLTGFALWLGADSFAIGLLTAIPTLAGLVQIVSSYTGERAKSRKAYVAISASISRVIWLLILLLPFVLPHSVALTVFLLLFTLSYAFANVPVPAWTSWMTDLVPPDYRGRYFGRRNMVAGIVGMLVGLPAAWFLDFATRRHHWEGVGFGTLFGIGVIGGLLSIVCVLRQPEPPRRMAGPASGGVADLAAYYRAPFADPNFRALMLFNIVFGIGQNFAMPFFTVYALQNLRLDYLWLQALATITSVASLVSMPLWGYLSDKFGSKPLLAIGVCGVFTTPLSWVLTTPIHPVLTDLLLVELNIAGGLFWAGVGLMQFNLLIGACPPEKTSIYVAIMAAVTGLAGGLAPMIGSVVMRALAGWHGSLPGLALTNFQVVFFISALLRLVALLFLRPVKDPGARSTRDVLNQLGRVGPSGWRNIRKLQRSGDVEERLRATEALGGLRTRLASDELQTALEDPSLAVREEAARALGEIRDRGAVESLLAAVRDPASGLVADAACALGRIGDRRANGALIALLHSDQDTLPRRDRLAVAQALGELGGVDAVDALLTALESAGDEEMAETLVMALGRIGAARAVPALTERLQTPETPRGLRIALTRALGEIGDPASRDALRAELAMTANDPALLPLLADALARLQDEVSVAPLLDHLNRLESPVARKQLAHAIGRLIGQDESAYNLLTLEEMARDGAVARLVNELLKQIKTPEVSSPLRSALDRYTAGDYGDCLDALRQASTALDSLPRSVSSGMVGCRRLLQQTATYVGMDVPAETVLLAFCALRGLIKNRE